MRKYNSSVRFLLQYSQDFLQSLQINYARRESISSSAHESQRDMNEYNRGSTSKNYLNQGSQRKSIAKINLNIGNGHMKEINIREGDNPYTLASNIVNEHGLDRSIVHELRNRIAKVYTDNI